MQAALGARFHTWATAVEVFDFEVVGVAATVRGDRPQGGTDSLLFVAYAQLFPNPQDGYVNFLVRLDDRYARLYGDTRVAAGVTTAFGLVAFLVAVAGVYAVMAFLVAARTKDIGIRIALGAATRDIQHLIVQPSMGVRHVRCRVRTRNGDARIASDRASSLRCSGD